MIRLNRMAYPVTSLGPGRRMGLWVQGCSRRCPGCSARDTWDIDGGKELPVDRVAKEICDAVARCQLDGLTLTGGEPFDQGDALSALVDEVRCHLAGVQGGGRRSFDVLVFSGYELEEAMLVSPELWSRVDAAVCGPYRQDVPSLSPLVASGNQRYVCLTETGTNAHRTLLAHHERQMQFSRVGNQMVFAGLTDAGDLNRLEAALCARGVQLGGVSWRSS